MDTLQKLGCVRLLEGHRAFAHRSQPRGVVVDPDNRQSSIREGQRKRKPNAPEADHRDVGSCVWFVHLSAEVIGAWYMELSVPYKD